MNQAIKRLTSVQEGTVDMTSVVDIIINCFFETVNCMRSRISFFEAELIRRCFQIVREEYFQSMLEDFGKYGGYRNPSIVRNISQVPLFVFHNRNHVTKSKLIGDA